MAAPFLKETEDSDSRFFTRCFFTKSSILYRINLGRSVRSFHKRSKNRRVLRRCLLSDNWTKVQLEISRKAIGGIMNSTLFSKIKLFVVSLMSIVLLIAFQNCGKVNLLNAKGLGAGNAVAKSGTPVPNPDPDPDPERTGKATAACPRPLR